MITIVLATADLDAIINDFARQDAPTVVTMTLHQSRHKNGIEFIARRTTSRTPGTNHFYVWSFAAQDMPWPEEVEALLRGTRGSVAASVGLGIGPATGRVRVAAHAEDGSSIGLSLRLAGPGLPTLDFPVQSSQSSSLHWLSPRGLYSRTIGTLGFHAFASVVCSRIAVVGAGGNGSAMAMELARLMGPEAHLAVIDADTLEAWNLPAWAMPGGCGGQPLIGRNKALALSECVRAMPDPPTVEAVARSVEDWMSQEVLKRYPIVVSCVDNPAARFAVAFVAALYHRVLLDIGTGAFLGAGADEHRLRFQEESPTDGGNLRMPSARLPHPLLAAGPRAFGGDVRLIVPGHADQAGGNCLLCYGGVEPWEGMQGITSGTPKASTHDVTPFWKGRAGSLHVLNTDVVNMSIRLLTAFLAGEAVGSQHWQMDTTLTTPPQWRRVAIREPTPACPLCSRAGRGDDAWNERSQVAKEYQTQFRAEVLNDGPNTKSE